MDTKSPEFLPVLLMANFNQNIDFEDIENDRFENMVEIVNMSQMLNVMWRWQGWWNHQLKLNPSKFQTVTKYALFYSFVIVIEISGELCAIAAVRDPSVLDM